jgi:hypothetical protein
MTGQNSKGGKVMDKVLQLTRLFECITRGAEPSRVLDTARVFLSTIGPKDIVDAEKRMLELGYSASELKRLYPAEMQILHGRTNELFKLLPPNHLVRRVLSEHQMFLCFLADLEDVNRAFRSKKVLSPAGTEFRKLALIARHIISGLDHIHLEDELIFPALENYGYLVTPQILTNEHISMTLCAEKLMKLVILTENGIITDLGQFKNTLDELTTAMITIGREHIFREDNILYPIAVQLIEDSKIWERIKALSEEVGYCSM